MLSSYDGADGVKTGYTKKAGRCFVGSATKNGMQVVVVVLNCGPMFEDTAKLLDYAFANYSLRVAVPENKLCGVVYERGKPTYYYCSEGFSYPLKEGEQLKCNVVLQEDKQQIEVYLGDSCVFRRNLTAQTQFGR